MPLWMKGDAPENDVVVSTRVRLARNMAGVPFPGQMRTNEQKQQVIQAAKDALLKKGVTDFEYSSIVDLGRLRTAALVEKHLISAEMAEKPDGGLILGRDEKLSIMVLEEDHFRLQCLLPGLKLTEAYILVDELDDMLAKSVRYAYDEKLGYLSSCPTNVGTGLRASVMMHLPALNMSGAITEVLRTISNYGYTARGIYGEGSGAQGSVYQISNQITIGWSEEEITNGLKATVLKIIEQEREKRKELFNSLGVALEDRIFRSYGLLKYAKRIRSDELLECVSDLNFGVSLGLMKDMKSTDLYALMVDTRPAVISEQAKKQLPNKERDIMRAAAAKTLF